MTKNKSKSALPIPEISVVAVSQSVIDKLKEPPKKDLYMVTLGDDVLCTPYGSPIVHHNKTSLNALAGELKNELKLYGSIDVSKFSLFSLLCTKIEFDYENKTRLEDINNDFLNDVIPNDIVFNTYAGPEVIDQLVYFKIIEEYLKDYGFTYFNRGGNNNLQVTASHIQAVVKNFTACQRSILVNVIQVFDSPILGVLLATQHITVEQFANVVTAANCFLPDMFSGGVVITKSASKKYSMAVAKDAQCMVKFLFHFND